MMQHSIQAFASKRPAKKQSQCSRRRQEAEGWGLGNKIRFFTPAATLVLWIPAFGLRPTRLPEIVPPSAIPLAVGHIFARQPHGTP